MGKGENPARDTVAQYLELLGRTDKEKPKPEDMAALRRMLNERPELWRRAGDLAEHAALNVISTISATPPIKESIKRGVKALRAELGYDESPALERLLIEQVVLCWLRINLVEHQYMNAVSGPVTPEVAEHWERRLSAAQRRYTRAAESLALRKLTRYTPTLQVNIAADGGQQVNVLKAEVSGQRKRLPRRPERDKTEE